MNWKIIIGCIVCMVVVFSARAQQSNFRTKSISTSRDTILLDSLSIIPSAFQINGIEKDAYQLIPDQSILIWKKKPTQDSVQVNYRVFRIDLTKEYFHKDIKNIQPEQNAIVNPFKYTKIPVESKGVYFGGLNKKGSVSRGISFGNNQDLGVTSNLNLQLSGKVTEKIKVLASISDQNIPVQPDGNTQQIQDFDQVYIQLFSDKTKLTAGDYQIKSQNTYFLRYNKRLRGGDIQTRFGINKQNPEQTNEVGFSAAVSRGKFARNTFFGLEGNQGPYRLTGSENESFIIILSGTEVVYIDGQQLKRGQENDYTIDYNNAEIVFTANQPITKDKRIIVEFQYSSQVYSRSLIRFTDQLNMGKLKLNLNLYSEQDSKNQTLQQDLSEEQRAILEDIGNDIDLAFGSGVSQVAFEDDRVLYKKVYDTLSLNVIDSHYVFSTDPDSAIYQLSFSDVGEGNGDYVQIQSNANGKVYQYISPFGGQKQGNYEPIVLLITPKKRQMFSIGGTYQLDKNSYSEFDLAFSNNDVNTFSEKGNSSNTGTGLKFKLVTNKTLGSQKKWAFTGEANYEQVSKNFSAIERFRSVEFERDWNLSDIELSDDQYIPGIQLNLQRDKEFKVGYDFKSFLSGEEYNGTRNGINVASQIGNTEFAYQGSLLSVNTLNQQSEFYRHQINALQKGKYFELGFKDIYENNQFTDKETDSLSNASYEFWEWQAYVQNPSKQKNRVKLGYINRFDKFGRENELKEATLGESVQLELGWLKNKSIQVKSKSTYRKLNVLDTNLYSGQPEENVTSRIEYNLKLWKGALSTSSFYEIGSGLEEKSEFVYVEVGAGLGQYVWIDVNENGVKELSEFQPKKFDNEGNYIKVRTQTNDFIRTYSNQFSQSLFLNPTRIWKTTAGVRKFLIKFSNQTTYRIERKTEKEDGAERFNPFTNNIEDSSLISIRSSLRNVLYFNRSHPKTGLEWAYQDVRNKLETFNGTESKSSKYHTLGWRYNITTALVFNVAYTDGEKVNRQEIFTENDYTIQYYKIVPKLTYQANVNWKSSVYLSQTLKENSGESINDQAEISEFGLEVQLSKVGKGIVQIGGSILDITYDGSLNTTVSYEMLDGLQPGKNGIWNVVFQRGIGKNLQLNLNYNGRITETSDIVHSGSAQIRAFF